MEDFRFDADYWLLTQLRSLCVLTGEDSTVLIEESIREAAVEFENRERAGNGYLNNGWGFRETKIRTEDPVLLRSMGRFPRAPFDVAINHYLRQKVMERRRRSLSSPQASS